jgi:hypothetical protein
MTEGETSGTYIGKVRSKIFSSEVKRNGRVVLNCIEKDREMLTEFTVLWEGHVAAFSEHYSDRPV